MQRFYTGIYSAVHSTYYAHVYVRATLQTRYFVFLLEYYGITFIAPPPFPTPLLLRLPCSHALLGLAHAFSFFAIVGWS